MSTLGPVLVTGASGFIGRYLCGALQESGAQVHALMRNAAQGPWHEVVNADIGAEMPVDVMSGIDTVFHLAGKAHALAEVRGDEEQYRRVNVRGTERLIDAAELAGVRCFVFFSSVKAMGEGSDACLDEQHPDRPETPYGISKLEAEGCVLGAAERGMHGVVLRLPLVYGPGSKGNLANMLRQTARGRFPPLGDLGNKRSLVHVEDVVQAALLAAARPRAAGQRYIVTDGNAYSTTRIYRAMCQALGREVPAWTVPGWCLALAAAAGDLIGRARGRRFIIDSDALAKLTGSAWYSSAKIETELGFEARQSLEQALPGMVLESERSARRERCTA